MPVERFYSEGPLMKGELIALTDQEFHHLVHVIRRGVGNEIEIVNGKGTIAQATVEKIEKRKVLLRIDSILDASPPSFKMILAQAVPRMNRLDYILEKGTELGVDEIWLFFSERGEKQLITPNQLERLKSITIAAMKQCGRLFLPKIVLMPKLERWPQLLLPAFFGDLSPTAPLLIDQLPALNSKGALFFVGPESGFSTEEEQALIQLGALGVKLHHNILRTDTAAIVGLALLCQKM